MLVIFILNAIASVSIVPSLGSMFLHFCLDVCFTFLFPGVHQLFFFHAFQKRREPFWWVAGVHLCALSLHGLYLIFISSPTLWIYLFRNSFALSFLFWCLRWFDWFRNLLLRACN
ncbi:MAG: hypothetical protein B7Z80_00935 [Rhodospirillales bacterium 20-64-7]|nr:MAG: hypothetical protein B7Z80_00935 [Rhodospirillales bacterium 20-64-7]